jgi:hypothetical protein
MNCNNTSKVQCMGVNQPTPCSKVIKLVVDQTVKELPTYYGTPNVYYCVHRSSTHVPVLSLMNEPSPYASILLRVHFNILPSVSSYSKWSLSFKLFNQNFVCICLLLSRVCCMPFSFHYLWYDHVNKILPVKIMKLLIIQFCSYSCYVHPLGPQMFSDLPRICYSVNLRDQVSQIVTLCILVFNFLRHCLI